MQKHYSPILNKEESMVSQIPNGHTENFYNPPNLQDETINSDEEVETETYDSVSENEMGSDPESDLAAPGPSSEVLKSNNILMEAQWWQGIPIGPITLVYPDGTQVQGYFNPPSRLPFRKQ